MSNRLTRATGLVGGLRTDTRTAVQLGSSSAYVTDYVKVIPLVGAGSTSEQDSAYDIPTYGRVVDAAILISAASSAGSSIEVGLLSSESGGDADGFIDVLGTTSTGVKAPGFVASTSGSPDVFWASNTYGVLLSTFNAGTTAASDFGLAMKKDHLNDSVTAKSVSWTLNSTGTAFRANLMLHIVEYTS